jgi:hypothetical protein
VSADVIRLAEHLPPGRTVEQAIQRALAKREYLATRGMDDDACQELQDYCASLYGGDRLMGQLLASYVAWI